MRLPDLTGARGYHRRVAPNSPDPDGGINPDDVARRTFTASRKGFDPIEVQGFLVSVASELRASRSRVLELEQELRVAQQDADRNREIDPARLTALLGEETARVLDAARLAADDMRAKAADSSSRLIREATDDAARMRQEAAEILAAKTREADAAMVTMRQQLDELEVQARAQAAEEIEAGRQEGREMVAEAQKVRERMLNDLARRRKAFRQQIERLQAGRDRLLAAYDVVRDTLDVATEELQVALPEAREAAESASLRAAGEDEATADELEAEAATLPQVEPEVEPESAAEPDATAESEPGSGSGSAVGAEAEPGDGSAAAGGPEAAADGEPIELTDADVEAEPAPVIPLASSPDDHEGRRSSSVKVVRARSDSAPAADSGDSPEPDPDPADPAAGPSEADTTAPGGPGVDSSSSENRGETDPDGDEAGEGGSEVSSLFARIRSEAEIEADAAAAAAEAAGDTPTPTVAVVIEEIAVVGDDGSVEVIDIVEVAEIESESESESNSEIDAEVDPDAALIARRDAALVDIERGLGRRIKRELSDEQNELLDTVRRQKGVPTADETLPSLDVHIKRYADSALASLAAAASAGADLVDGATSGAATKTKAGDLATELATELIEGLRRRMENCFREAAGDDEELAERLRACYREWKGQRVDELASRSVLAACNRGLVDRLPKGTLVHWAVDDGSTPSPDCDDNALAGDQPKGEPFPTGHVVPPISATWRCMVVPSAS